MAMRMMSGFGPRAMAGMGAMQQQQTQAQTRTQARTQAQARTQTQARTPEMSTGQVMNMTDAGPGKGQGGQQMAGADFGGAQVQFSERSGLCFVTKG